MSGSFGIKFKPMVKLSSTCMLIRVRLENDTFSGVMFVLPFCRRTTTPVSINTTNMEPENHTVGKKNHHRNLHYWIPYRISGVYDICYVWKGSYWKILALGAFRYGPHISSISVSSHRPQQEPVQKFEIQGPKVRSFTCYREISISVLQCCET